MEYYGGSVRAHSPLIQRGAFPLERVGTAPIDMDATVSGGFDVLIDPDGSAITILVGVS